MLPQDVAWSMHLQIEAKTKSQQVDLKFWVSGSRKHPANALTFLNANLETKHDVNKLLPGTCIFKSDFNIKSQQMDLNYCV